MTASIERDPRVLQPSRVIVGHCPACARVIVITNEFESWPYVECVCSFKLDTTSIAHHARFEREGVVQIAWARPL